MRSCREFPLVRRTQRSDLATLPKPSQTEKEWGRLTLVNIDLLLPPILPGLLLSALWWVIRRHIHTHVLTETNLPLQFSSSWCFLQIVIFMVSLTRPSRVSCMLRPLCLLCFYDFCASRFNVHINVCPGLSICAYSWTGLQPVALIGPCVSLASGVSPYQQDFQGFPSISWHCTSLFPSHTHAETHTRAHIKRVTHHWHKLRGREWKNTNLCHDHWVMWITLCLVSLETTADQIVRKTDHGRKNNPILFPRP